MLGIATEIGSSALRLWVAAGSAALLVIICALVFRRRRTGAVASAARALLVILGAALAGLLTWAFLDSAAVRDQAAERRALEMRAAQLTAQALAPASPLACLDAVAGATVEMACEKAVFASPASVAAAISFVAAQFVLLSDMTAYTERDAAGIDSALLPLRSALEADPFGLLAHVLVMRSGCTSQNCPAFTVLHDPSHVRTNLIAQTLDHYLDRYREAWAKQPDAPVAALGDPQLSAATQGNGTAQRKVVVNIDFPSAASIPPISIMDPEPRAPAAPGAAAPNPAATAAAPGRVVRKHAAKPAAPEPGQGGAPSQPGAAAQTEPVWTPATPPAAQ
jgi:hypothetical protein